MRLHLLPPHRPPAARVDGPDHHVVDQPRAPDPRGDGDQHGPPVEARSAGVRSSASRASRYSGSIPAASSSARAAASAAAASARPPAPRPRPRSEPRLSAAARGAPLARRGRRCASSSRGRRARARSARPRSRPGSRGRGHAPDHDRLLGVLLAEEGDVGPTTLSSFATTVVTPRKCSGPAPRRVAVEHLGERPPTSTAVAKPSG